MPFFPLLRSVTAMITAVSATRPLVMKVFEPLSTQWAPSRTAVVLVPPASEPALFSVRPQQPTFSPRASGTRCFLFCSSLPARKIWAEHRLWWAASDSATPASTRDSSSMTTAQSRVDMPEPPYSVGQATPMRPSSASLAKTSRGKACFSSHSREWGASSPSANSRTVFLRSRCSSLRLKSKSGASPPAPEIRS